MGALSTESRAPSPHHPLLPHRYVVFCNPRNRASLGTLRLLYDLGRDPYELADL
jgi:hypothetical protein